MDDLLVATFEAHNPTRNHHRWYRVRVGKDLFGDWTVHFGYGRVGLAGQSMRYGGPATAPLQRAVRDCLLRRLSAPGRIGCAYRLTRLEAATGFDISAWLPPDALSLFETTEYAMQLRPACPRPRSD